MLRSLHIKNYILIDSLDVEFPEGLVIITGQTGAGKSILLGALGLLCGAKADASMIGGAADNCIVEAEFDGADSTLDDILSENDVETDSGHLLIRRVVAKSGRSRSFVNDCPVQVGLLQEIGSRLVDIHSQHRSLLLTDPSFQLSILDHYAGNAGLLEDCRASWRRLAAARSELSQLESSRRTLSADYEYNKAQWEQLEAARLRDGELEELEEEHNTLANAERIMESLEAASELFRRADGSFSVDASLKEAGRQLGHIESFLPAASSLAERLESARMELSDIESEVSSLASGVNMSPGRLEEVEDRMSALYSLMKKHGCSSVSELIEVRDRFDASLYDAGAVEEKILLLNEKIRAEKAVYDGICSKLSASRAEAAPGFSSSITGSLRFLELDRAEFKAEVRESVQGPSGADSVVFLFSGTGNGLQDVSKCASGGEISRIMLCLKAMMARFVGMPTLIFDEIDTGVSGSVADKMGRMICEMGRDMQVFSITHLPQVAAKGNAHYVVSKLLREDGRTVSEMSEVSGERRVMEIARLLSGAAVTDAAIANARSLLQES